MSNNLEEKYGFTRLRNFLVSFLAICLGLTGFTLAWLRHENFKIHHIIPTWFIPIVGCIIIPIAGIIHFSAELSWFFSV